MRISDCSSDVCSSDLPFPCMPIGFWNDPDDERYRAAYFETYPGIWRHGDFVELTGHNGIVVYGRSDATLNPGGVRIGTAEIYREVEKLRSEEQTSELQSLMRISYAVFCLKKKTI